MTKQRSGNVNEALAQILEILQGVVGNECRENPQGTGEGESGDYGCTPMELPPEMQGDAAAKAVLVNPQNAPQAEFLRVADSAPALPSLSGGSVAPAAVVSVTRWWGAREREFPVYFMSGGSQSLLDRIVAEMNTWHQWGGIRFRRTNSISEGIVRISFDGSGYWSYIGTDILGRGPSEPTMNLQSPQNLSASEFRRLITHETGHTLGLQHEQLRPELVRRIDRDKAYAYFWQTNRWDRAKVDFNVLTPLDMNQNVGTPVDEDSVMCYILPGSITIDGRRIGGGLSPSRLDAWLISAIYPKGTGAPLGSRPAVKESAYAQVASHASPSFSTSAAGSPAASPGGGSSGHDWNRFDSLLGL